MYDVIIVGSRCAGAPTAMLLARQGRRVLVVERSTFPSDVLSGHTFQPDGVARLARWGLLDRIAATDVPFAEHVRFDFGPVVLDGAPVPVDGISAAVCIRRTIIDPLLTDAASEAGAEVRFGVTVNELIVEDGRVVGIRGHNASGELLEERAHVVVGADGARSFVARAVNAPMLDHRPATTVAVYSYWRGLEVDGIELYVRPGRFFVAAPTNDDLTFVTAQFPVAEAARVREHVADAFLDAVRDVPLLASRLESAERAERYRFAQVPDSFVRKSYGPGWALVGDAACHKDPVTAQGMLDAVRDAELLATAIHAGLDGDLDACLAGYQAQRDEVSRPMFEYSCALADLESPPPPEMLQLIDALEGRPAQIARFLGVIAGSVPVTEFFAPANIASILGRQAA
jgi:2-polyprenyl-6-methoxyphenol hydroxylase-like FAD-dependent oxidoreductase